MYMCCPQHAAASGFSLVLMLDPSLVFVMSSFVFRGCLFYGPPGTGKTLVANALANECSQGARKVSFFMRKGADCLSKWVGESERHLRRLFDKVNHSTSRYSIKNTFRETVCCSVVSKRENYQQRISENIYCKKKTFKLE